MPEFKDPRFVKISPKRSYSVIENERFGLVFAKTGSIVSGTGCNRAFYGHVEDSMFNGSFHEVHGHG